MSDSNDLLELLQEWECQHLYAIFDGKWLDIRLDLEMPRYQILHGLPKSSIFTSLSRYLLTTYTDLVVNTDPITSHFTQTFYFSK